MRPRSRRFLAPWAALALLLALLALALLDGCTRRSEAAARDAATAATRDSSAGAGAVPATDAFSVYDLTGTWRDQSGASRTLADLRGTPVLVALVYTHCTATCPLAVAELKRVAAVDHDVRFLLVSLDPVRDDPARLAAFARERDLEPSRWTLLSGSDAGVRDLAATLGVRYRRVTPDDLAHSNLITLLDRDGRIVRQVSGRIDDAALARLHDSAR